jgi:endonuclease-3
MSPVKVRKILGIIASGEKIGPQAWNLRNPFEVLVGTVLSQRTRDGNTSKAAAGLFSRYRTPEEIASAPLKDIERLIRVSGFYRVKAKRLKEMSRMILERYDGRVPASMEELVTLPGVGRKTAGCVLVYGFGIPAIPTDTHVHRISNRLGFVKTNTPEQTEQRLMKVLPRDMWIPVNSAMVRFGQRTCKPVRPRCRECHVARLCEFGEKNLKQGK